MGPVLNFLLTSCAWNATTYESFYVCISRVVKRTDKLWITEHIRAPQWLKGKNWPFVSPLHNLHNHQEGGTSREKQKKWNSNETNKKKDRTFISAKRQQKEGFTLQSISHRGGLLSQFFELTQSYLRAEREWGFWLKKHKTIFLKVYKALLRTYSNQSLKENQVQPKLDKPWFSQCSLSAHDLHLQDRKEVGISPLENPRRETKKKDATSFIFWMKFWWESNQRWFRFFFVKKFRHTPGRRQCF